MKIKVIDPNGVHFSGKVLPVDSVHEIAKGPHTGAWLRFKQVEEVKGKKGEEDDKPEKGGKPDKDEKK